MHSDPSHTPDPAASIRELQQLREQLLPLCELPESTDQEMLSAALSDWISHWMQRDLSRVMQLLYRVDVPEKAVAAWLAAHPYEDSACGLARMVLSRQLEKVRLRRHHTPKTDIPEEERW